MTQTISPSCSIFGQCGGCSYQDIPYSEELALKDAQVKELFNNANILIDEQAFLPIVPSPQEYNTRHRIDLTLIRTKEGEHLMGFNNPLTRQLLEINACPTARQEISDFIPQLKEDAIAMLPPKYKRANLTVRCGQDGRVVWGGIGKGSLKMNPADYLWAEVNGIKIHYALDTFFQANLFILQDLIDTIKTHAQFKEDTVFLDLYAGVGLFGLSLSKDVSKAILIEDSKNSGTLAQYNIDYLKLKHVKTLCQSVDDALPGLLRLLKNFPVQAIIDPPRKGLSKDVAKLLSQSHSLEKLFYLSCNPETLVRDLKFFQEEEWTITQVIPFDFFPKTHHIETLVIMEHA